GHSAEHSSSEGARGCRVDSGKTVLRRAVLGAYRDSGETGGHPGEKVLHTGRLFRTRERGEPVRQAGVSLSRGRLQCGVVSQKNGRPRACERRRWHHDAGPGNECGRGLDRAPGAEREEGLRGAELPGFGAPRLQHIALQSHRPFHPLRTSVHRERLHRT
ncbi:unnamed protein product, partial [Amoebophrya sp. A120]